MEVHITDLTKDYGVFHALKQVSLTIGPGIFGLLGPNGAGKSTLIKILTTLLLPTSGTVSVDGVNIRQKPEYVRNRLGYIPQSFGFYPRLNAYELLDYIGAMKNLPRAERKRQIEHLLDQVRLAEDAHRPVGVYSGGMKQRLGIAQALLGDPQLLVVDEPTAGLDPEERIRFRNLLARLSDQRTVILSTHIVADIETSCNRVAVLNKGRLVSDSTPEELRNAAMNCVWQLEIENNEWKTLELKHNIVASRSVDNGKLLVRVLAEVNPLGRGERISPSLEDGYMMQISEAIHVYE